MKTLRYRLRDEKFMVLDCMWTYNHDGIWKTISSEVENDFWTLIFGEMNEQNLRV